MDQRQRVRGTRSSAILAAVSGADIWRINNPACVPSPLPQAAMDSLVAWSKARVPLNLDFSSATLLYAFRHRLCFI